jgi:hypothetical protein
MKLDEHFKNALKQAVTNEPPVVDPRGRFEARLGRSRRVRTATYAFGLAVAAIAAVLVVPRVLPQRDTGVLEPGPSETPSPTSGTGIDTAQWKTYYGNGWSLKYSPKWHVQLFEGDTEFVPQDLKGTAVGEPTFALIVRPESDSYAGVTFPSDTTVEGTWNDGHKYRQWHSTDPAKPHSETMFEIDDAHRLHVIYFASTAALWDRYVREADASFDSLTFTTPITPKHGDVMPGVEFGPATRTLVDFMDARIEGSGAESYLGAAATEYYANHDKGLSLYSPTSNPHYASYEVASYEQIEGNLVQTMFIVKIVEEYTGDTKAQMFW